MRKITIGLETLTAAFVHADTEEARWRAAPFRGLARYWFRAVTGASLAQDHVRIAEAELFGTSETASPVAFRLLAAPARTPVEVDVNPGGERSGRRQAFLPPAALKLAVQANAWTKGAEAERLVQQAYAAVWLSVHLGGVGQRARRGGGSLRMTAVEPSAALPVPANAASAEALAAQLKDGIAACRHILGAERLRPAAGGRPEFPVLLPPSAEVVVAETGWGPSEEAVRLRLMNLRRSCHRPGTPQGGRRFEPEFGAIGARGDRIASPLWVRVARIDPPRTLVVVTLMRHQGAERLGADWRHAEEFIRKLNGVRVSLG